jgi:hypothetical protein
MGVGLPASTARELPSCRAHVPEPPQPRRRLSGRTICQLAQSGRAYVWRRRHKVGGMGGIFQRPTFKLRRTPILAVPRLHEATHVTTSPRMDQLPHNLARNA